MNLHREIGRGYRAYSLTGSGRVVVRRGHDPKGGTMANTAGRSGGKFPPDNLEGAVRWVWDESREKTWTNTWDRLICRPKAYELGIPGVISAEAPRNDEFLRAVKDFKKKQSQNFSTETHFVNRGVQWGWRYDKGISEIQLGRSIQVVAVLPKDAWIASRTDTAAFKRLSDDEKRRQKIQVERLEKQLLEGTWKQSGLIRESHLLCISLLIINKFKLNA